MLRITYSTFLLLMLSACSFGGQNINENVDVGDAGLVENVMKISEEEGKTVEVELQDVLEIDTSDWLTYKNNDIGYTLKYPSEWKVDEYEKIFVGKERIAVRIYLKSVLTIHKGEKSFFSKFLPQAKILEPIFIDGHKTYLAYSEKNMDRLYHRYFLERNNEYISLYFYLTDEESNKESNKKIIYKILDTIKFTK